MYNGLTVASWALTDMLPGQGGFCCIPGSHKSNFSSPPQLKAVKDSPECMKGVHQKAGDVAIFTEALTHGTLAVGSGPSPAFDSGEVQPGPCFLVAEAVSG